jgi:multidrug efflux pump
MIDGILSASFARTRTVLTLLVLLLITGLYAYQAIPKESSPDIDIPNIYISMALEGVSPTDSERLLIRPMEQELTAIEGVKEMVATAYQGGGYVLLEFQAGFDKDKALDDVQRAVDKAKINLPDSMDSDPSVNEVNFSLFPVLAVMLSGDVDDRVLLKLGQDLQDKIEAISSVLEVNIAGDKEELVEIILQPALMESYGLKGTELLNFFAASNRLVAAGNMDSGVGRFAIEVPGIFENVQDVMSMPVRVANDSAVTLGDIATIKKTFKDPESYARINGKTAIGLNVVKRTGENVIDTIERVKKVVQNEQSQWPEAMASSIKVDFILDNSKGIRDMLKDLQNNMISAVLLVMVVIIATLGFRSAFLVGVAIPGAFLSGVLFLYMTGFTVNTVVLFALIMSVGMLVDGAVVVTEYADRKLAEGHDKVSAYKSASLRMAWPIIASTMTTLAAFAPLLFWPDVVGEFMGYMPLTLIAVLLSSLFMALIFIPVLGSVIGKAGAISAQALENLKKSETGNILELDGMSGGYVKVLHKLLKVSWLVIPSTIVLMVVVMITYGKIGKGVEFFPDIEPEVASVLVHARGNLSIDEKDTILKQVEDRVLKIGGVDVFYTTVGQAGDKNSETAEDVIGQIQMEFADWDTRPPAKEILNHIRNITADIPGIKIEAQKQQDGPQGGKAIEIELSSRFPEKINPMVDLAYEAMNEIGDFIDVEDSRPLPGIQWDVRVDRTQASKFDLDLSVIGQYIRLVTYGLKITDYRPDDSDEEIDIVVRYPEKNRSLDQLDQMRIETSAGSVPISNFVERKAQPAIGTLNRSNQSRIVTVKADVPEGINASAKLDEVKVWLEANKDRIDPSVSINFRGEDEDQKRSQDFLKKAFSIALFVMALILITQFNSFYHSFLILSAVILSTIGVMLGLLIMDQPFGIVMTGVGVIALAGIVVNNNIVLIDTYKHIIAKGNDSPFDAILRTGAQRLRPVLLTTVTTVLGLIPMVLQMNIDFIGREFSIGAPSTQWWVQLSSAICFGLSFSTILTLVVTPCALYLPHQIKNGFKRFKKK